MDRHEERAHAAARQATAAQTSNRPLTSSSQIEQSQPCQLCGQRIVRADRILQEAVAQSSCLGRLIRKLHQPPASTPASEEVAQRG